MRSRNFEGSSIDGVGAAHRTTGQRAEQAKSHRRVERHAHAGAWVLGLLRIPVDGELRVHQWRFRLVAASAETKAHLVLRSPGGLVDVDVSAAASAQQRL